MKKLNTVLRFAVPFLLLAVVVTTHISMGLFAKYTARDDIDPEGARVANFEVWDDLSSSTVNLAMLPGEKITVRVKNKGETAVRCSLKVENLTLNLPIANPDPVVLNTGVIGAGDSSEVKLEIQWDALKNDPSYAGLIDLIAVTLTVEQVN